MSNKDKPSRRDVLRWTAATGVSPLAATTGWAQSPHQSPDARVKSFRTLGRTGLKISDISFGTARLRNGEEDLIYHALDRGINYFDSAYGYTRGVSEQVLGKALKGRRDQIYLVSKTETEADWPASRMMSELDESLRRMQTDYVDVYMCHAVNDVNRIKSPEWHNFVTRAKEQGKIRFVGISGHAGRLIDCLDYALDEDMVDVILAGYNFAQDPGFLDSLSVITGRINWVARQPDLPRVLAKAKKLNVGTIAMKTLQGARLNDMRPYERNGSTFAQAAFRWGLANSNIDALVVTMTGKDQIDEYLGASGANSLAYGDIELLRHYALLQSSSYCKHGCNDCADACPAGVEISEVLRTRMYATDYGDVAFAKDEYSRIKNNASACLSCSGAPCQDACTHGISINAFCGPTHNMLA